MPDARGDRQAQVAEVRAKVEALASWVDREEAAELAEAAVGGAIALARDYDAVRPPWVHNVLVNRGFRERGLCFHWANDLFVQLHELRLHSLDLHLAVAHMDTRKEHNAIVVTARGEPFNSGLVLDGWRRSGRLWSGTVATDKRYPWRPLPADRINEEVKKHL
jgi:hypothetical protein